MIRLVVFLGNHGKKYAKNRHNVAWLFADSLSLSRNATYTKKFNGEYAVYEKTDGEKLYFLKPSTYMNLSGQSAHALASFFKIKPEEILVVHDELEVKPGTVSLKWSGGLGGHNGLRSMKACFGTADFWRLRIGIGRPDGIKTSGQDVAGFVLSDFTYDESILMSLVFEGLETLMNDLLAKDADSLIKEWAKKVISD